MDLDKQLARSRNRLRNVVEAKNFWATVVVEANGFIAYLRERSKRSESQQSAR
jgi:hypothetical protein